MPIASNAMEVESDVPVREGRIREFQETAERRRPQLLRMARRLTQNPEDAEDILQEAFLKAFKALAKFRGESQMSSWLGAIVQNTAHEHLRSRRNRVLVSIEYLCRMDNEVVELDLPDPGRNPEESWESREMAQILRQEVGRLSFLCRRAIELCVLDELPQQTAATALNLNVATMKSRVFRAKRILSRTISHRLESHHGSMPLGDRRLPCEPQVETPSSLS